MIHTIVTEARNLLALHTARLDDLRITQVEDVKFDHTTREVKGLVMESITNNLDEEDGPEFAHVDIVVWNGYWMFGLNVQPQTTVTVTYEGPEGEYLSVPRADRTNQWCVYGVWRNKINQSVTN